MSTLGGQAMEGSGDIPDVTEARWVTQPHSLVAETMFHFGAGFIFLLSQTRRVRTSLWRNGDAPAPHDSVQPTQLASSLPVTQPTSSQGARQSSEGATSTGAMLYQRSSLIRWSAVSLVVQYSRLYDLFLRMLTEHPQRAAWFVKTSVLFSIVSGITLSIPLIIYVFRHWDTCGLCSRPLRWWLVAILLVHGVQMPLRYSFYRRISTCQQQSLRSRPLQPVPTGELATSASASTGPQQSTEPSVQPRRTDVRQNEETTLALTLDTMTKSCAWKLSMRLAVLVYLWFLVGALWAFTEEGSCCCVLKDRCSLRPYVPSLNDKHTKKPLHRQHTEPLDALADKKEDDDDPASFLFASIQHTTLFIDQNGEKLSKPSNDKWDEPNNAKEDTFLFQDVTRPFSRISTIQTLTLVVIGVCIARLAITLSLFYLAVPISPSDTTTTLVTTTPRNPVAQAATRPPASQRRNVTSTVQRSQRALGLPSKQILQLPILHYSHHVFPRALRSASSIQKVLSNIENEYRKTILRERSTWFHSIVSQLPLRRALIESADSLTAQVSILRRTFTAARQSEASFYDQYQRDYYINPLRMMGRFTPKASGWELVYRGRSAKRMFWIKMLEQSSSWTPELFEGPPLYTSSCSICLDDFWDGDRLRQLPCRHSFHCCCIERWLAQVNACPLCHYRCVETRTQPEGNNWI